MITLNGQRHERTGLLQMLGSDGRRYSVYVYGDDQPARGMLELKDGTPVRWLRGETYELASSSPERQVRLVAEGPMRPTRRRG